MKATSNELDLAGTIRPGLDTLANEIVIALKRRSRFPANQPVYTPGLVVGSPDITLLQYELLAAERNHAELGRYAYAAQDSFNDMSDVKPVIERRTPQSAVKRMPSGVGEKIIDFYLAWVGKACEQGTDENTFGETVTTDVLALLAVMERVNLGKVVAESKLQEQPDAFLKTGGDRDAMLALIVRPDRQDKVFDLARELATRYEVPEILVVELFEFMVATTIDIEVDYLRIRLAEMAS